MPTKIFKTTLAESPDAEQELSEIKPDEVSIVDYPAVGEPFVVAKRGGTMGKEVKKYNSSMVPRPVMKNVCDRMTRVKSMVSTILDVTKRLPVDTDGTSEYVPPVLVSMTKSAAAELRSIQPSPGVDVKKRGRAESVLSVHELTKRAEQLEEIEKTNAVSYLMRDQYVSVYSSVDEWLTTYVDGVEHDDDGPYLIPTSLDKVVDESAAELEKLADEYPASDEPADPDEIPEIDPDAEVKKLHGEITTLRETLKAAQAAGKVGKKGSKMAAARLDTLKSVSSGISDASGQLSDIIKELEDDTEEGEPAMADNQTPEETKKNAPAPSEPAPEPAQKGVQTTPSGNQVTNEQLMEALTKSHTETTDRFKALEERLGTVEETAKSAAESAKSATEEVEKMHRDRGDAHGSDTDDTTAAVAKNAKPSSDMSNLLFGGSR